MNKKISEFVAFSIFRLFGIIVVGILCSILGLLSIMELR